MCTQYWNFHATYICPACGTVQDDKELQTHWMGDDWSCRNHYRLGEPVKELKGIDAVTLQPGDNIDPLGVGEPYSDEALGATCDVCDAEIEFGIRIEGGAVSAIWPHSWERWELRDSTWVVAETSKH